MVSPDLSSDYHEVSLDLDAFIVDFDRAIRSAVHAETMQLLLRSDSNQSQATAVVSFFDAADSAQWIVSTVTPLAFVRTDGHSIFIEELIKVVGDRVAVVATIANRVLAMDVIKSCWILVTVEPARLLLNIFSLAMQITEKHSLSQHIAQSSMRCLERVNQLTLLHELNESHFCRYTAAPLFHR